MSKEYDAIIIGAGFSGLSVAALLTKAGQKVIVLEAMSQVAGRATTYKHVFRGREYHLDLGGTHIVDMPFRERGTVVKK